MERGYDIGNIPQAVMNRTSADRPPPARPAAWWLLIVALAGVPAIASCGDESTLPTAPRGALPVGMVISEPVTNTGPSGLPAGRVYVSASPGTFPDGESGRLTNLATVASVTSSLEDGGFDPITIRGSPGDELELVVANAGGTTTTVVAVVPERKSPQVVRTWPSDGRGDVPLDGTVGVILSEPVDESTITSETIELLRDADRLGGTLKLSEDRLKAEFAPSELLAAGASYKLVVASGVRDLAGDPLETNVEVSFSTGQTLAFVSLSAGRVHTCVVTAGGRAYCWGRNSFGELGTDATTETCFGDSPCSSRPLRVSGDLSWVQVSTSANAEHTCAVTTDGAAYCWGRNRYGQLGDGSTINQETPVPVSGELLFAAISAGADHTCGVTPGRDGYCWGRDWRGALGSGGSATETCADGRGVEWPCSTTPRLVTGGLTYSSISAGSGHTCAVAAEGIGYCWGDNQDGELGIGTLDNSVTRAVPVRVTGGLIFASISAGGAHSCGITTADQGYCWGGDMTGALGNGWSPEGLVGAPGPVAGEHQFSWLDAGWSHTCGVTTSGQAYCWGQGHYGKLGDGSTAIHIEQTPVPVSGSLFLASITTGLHTCALTASGEAYCWGRNRYGQLGDGTTDDRATPVRVVGQPSS